MKAKYINEKFDETTDPIKDMHIGGVDLKQIWSETVNAGVREWYKRLYDLDLIGKKVTFTNKYTGKEITMIIDDIKRGQLPSEMYFYSKKKIKHQLDIQKKLYIHE